MVGGPTPSLSVPVAQSGDELAGLDPGLIDPPDSASVHAGLAMWLLGS